MNILDTAYNFETMVRQCSDQYIELDPYSEISLKNCYQSYLIYSQHIIQRVPLNKRNFSFYFKKYHSLSISKGFITVDPRVKVTFKGIKLKDKDLQYPHNIDSLI